MVEQRWRQRSVTGAMSRGIPYASSMTEEPTTSTSSWFHPLKRKRSAPPSTIFKDISRSDTKVAERRMATATASLPRPAVRSTPLWHLSSSAVYVQATTMVATTAWLSESGRTASAEHRRAPRRTRPFWRREGASDSVAAATGSCRRRRRAAVLGRLRLVCLVLLGGVFDGGDDDGDDEVENDVRGDADEGDKVEPDHLPCAAEVCRQYAIHASPVRHTVTVSEA